MLWRLRHQFCNDSIWQRKVTYQTRFYNDVGSANDSKKSKRSFWRKSMIWRWRHHFCNDVIGKDKVTYQTLWTVVYKDVGSTNDSKKQSIFRENPCFEDDGSIFAMTSLDRVKWRIKLYWTVFHKNACPANEFQKAMRFLLEKKFMLWRWRHNLCNDLIG